MWIWTAFLPQSKCVIIRRWCRYRWQLVEPFDKTHLEKVSNHYQADANPNRMVGVGGTETWTFKALKSGHAEIQLRYIRSWEAQDPSAQVAKYQIKID